MTVALLIDDDPGLCQTLESNAAEEGLALRTASTWNEGLALFHVLSPDLVIADYNLPGSEHGLRLLLAVKRLRPAVRVILISGVVNADELRRVEELGVVDRVISKGAGIQATRQLLDEIRDSAGHSRRPTDWVALAKALIDFHALDKSSIDELDDRLRTDIDRL